MFKQLPLIFFLLCYFPLQAWAFNTASFKEPSIMLGNLTTFAGQVQLEEGDETNRFEWNPYLSLMYPIHFHEKWSGIPQFGVAFPKKARDRDNSRKETYFLGADFGYYLNDFVFKGGIGMLFTRLGGKGGTKTLPNGENSRTAFYLPDQKKTTLNFTWDLGMEYFLWPKFSIGGEVLLHDLRNKYTRSVSYMMGLTYHFGGQEKRLAKFQVPNLQKVQGPPEELPELKSEKTTEKSKDKGQGQ